MDQPCGVVLYAGVLSKKYQVGIYTGVLELLRGKLTDGVYLDEVRCNGCNSNWV
jgi:hypothetical protein